MGHYDRHDRAMDRYITGNWGEDQFKGMGPEEDDEAQACIKCGGSVPLDASWNEGLDGAWLCERCWQQAKAADEPVRSSTLRKLLTDRREARVIETAQRMTDEMKREQNARDEELADFALRLREYVIPTDELMMALGVFVEWAPAVSKHEGRSIRAGQAVLTALGDEWVVRCESDWGRDYWMLSGPNDYTTSWDEPYTLRVDLTLSQNQARLSEPLLDAINGYDLWLVQQEERAEQAAQEKPAEPAKPKQPQYDTVDDLLYGKRSVAVSVLVGDGSDIMVNRGTVRDVTSTWLLLDVQRGAGQRLIPICRIQDVVVLPE